MVILIKPCLFSNFSFISYQDIFVEFCNILPPKGAASPRCPTKSNPTITNSTSVSYNNNKLRTGVSCPPGSNISFLDALRKNTESRRPLMNCEIVIYVPSFLGDLDGQPFSSKSCRQSVRLR